MHVGRVDLSGGARDAQPLPAALRRRPVPAQPVLGRGPQLQRAGQCGEVVRVAGQLDGALGETVGRAVHGHQQAGRRRPGQRGRRERLPGELAAAHDDAAQGGTGLFQVAPQRGAHPGEVGAGQLGRGRISGAGEGAGPPGEVGVAVLLAGEAEHLAGPRQRGERQRAVGAGQRVRRGEQRPHGRRGPATAQFHLAAEQVGPPGDGRRHRPEAGQQQPGLPGVARTPGVRGGADPSPRGAHGVVAQLGGALQGGGRAESAVVAGGPLQFGGEPRFGAGGGRREVQCPAEPVGGVVQHPGEAPVRGPARGQQGGVRHHGPGGGVRERDAVRRDPDQPGQLGGGERGDRGAAGERGADEGVRRAVLVERGEQEHPPGVAGQFVEAGPVGPSERAVGRRGVRRRFVTPALGGAEPAGEVDEGLRVPAGGRGERRGHRRDRRLGQPVGEEGGALPLGQGPSR